MRRITLIAAGCLSAGPAFGGICEAVLPGWQGGRFNAIDQLMFMLSGPAMVVPFALLGLAILSPWYQLKAALGGAFFALAGLYAYDWLRPLYASTNAARVEGCQGNPLLFVALLLGLGALVFWRAMRQRAAG